MSIKILLTKDFGQLIGDITELAEGGYSIKNPCVVQMGKDQIGIVPLLGTVEEDTLILTESHVIGAQFTPVTELRNHYSSNFGGIELVTSSLVR